MAVSDQKKQQGKTGRLSQTALFALVCLGWLVLDFVTKVLVNNDAHALGQVFAGPWAGLIQFRLVYNTGAAWGIFGDSTFALGVFSCIMCVLLVAFYLWQKNDLNMVATLGLALVVAGGLGNAIDRFALGYVVDFIETAFMDFPVFNIADIGVTCGIVIFLVALFVGSPSGEEDAEACDTNEEGE